MKLFLCWTVEVYVYICYIDYWKSFLWRESEREGSHNTLTFRHFIILLSIKPPSRSEWVDRQKLAEIIVISPLKSPISVKNHVTPPPSILWIPPCEHHHHQTIPLHQHRLSNHLSPPIDIPIIRIGTNTNYSLLSQIYDQTAAFLDKPLNHYTHYSHHPQIF